MRQKIYLETSVVSYLVSRPSKNIVIAGRQAVTKDMWDIIDNYDAFISDIVIQESSKGDMTLAKLRLDALEKFNILKIDDEAKELAKLLIQKKPSNKWIIIIFLGRHKCTLKDLVNNTKEDF